MTSGLTFISINNVSSGPHYDDEDEWEGQSEICIGGWQLYKSRSRQIFVDKKSKLLL